MMRNRALRTSNFMHLFLLLNCLLLTACTAVTAPETELAPALDAPSVSESAPLPEATEDAPAATDVLTLGQGTTEIAELVGGAEAADDPIAFAEAYGLLLPLEAYDLDAPMTYREAVLVLYNALTCVPHDIPLEVVALDRRAEGLPGFDEAQRAVLFLYRWGILYRDEPADWNASIPASEWAELLTRLQAPDLRAKLTPDLPTRVACKLQEAFHCSCVMDCTDTELAHAEAGFAALLLGLEDPEPLLWNSFWFLERDSAGVFYLTAFSAADGETISLHRFSYNLEANQGADLETRTPTPCPLTQTGGDFAANLVRSICLTDKSWSALTGRLLPQYLQTIRDYPEDFSPLMAETYVGYVSPRWETPGLLLIGLQDGILHSQTLFEHFGNINYVDDMLAPSWYHLYD